MATKNSFLALLSVFSIWVTVVVFFAFSPALSADALDPFMRTAEPGQRATLEGVVSAVWPKQGRLGLIDAEEFKKCGVVTCAQMTLPVLWIGEMPQVASTVHATGEVKKKGMRLMFVAEVLETVAPPPSESR